MYQLNILYSRHYYNGYGLTVYNIIFILKNNQINKYKN